MKYRARSFAALSLALMLSACGSSQPETLSILAMDTAMTFSVYGDDADTVLSDASLEVRRLDALLSRTNPEVRSRISTPGIKSKSVKRSAGSSPPRRSILQQLEAPLTSRWHRYPPPGALPRTPTRSPLRKNWMPCLHMWAWSIST